MYDRAAQSDWPLRACSREVFVAGGHSLGVVGRWGTGKSHLLRVLASALAEAGRPVLFVADHSELPHLEPTAGSVVLVDDVELLDSGGHHALGRLLRQQGVDILVAWNPARRPMWAAPMAWRSRLTLVEHLEPVTTEQAERVFSSQGLPCFGEVVVEWCDGNRALVEMCRLRAQAIRPSNPQELWDDLTSAGVADELADRLFCTAWNDPEAVAKVLRLLALAGGDPRLLQAPFEGRHSVERVQNAFDELQRQGLANETNLTLSPPLLAAAVATAIPPEERDATHRAVARALEDRGYDLVTVASHLVQVRVLTSGWEREVVRNALDVHVHAGTVPEAVACLQKLVTTGKTPENAELLELLGVLLSRIDPTAGTMYLELALSTGQLENTNEVTRHLARNQLAAGDLGRAASTLLDVSDPTPDDLMCVQLLEFLSAGSLSACEPQGCQPGSLIGETLHSLHLMAQNRIPEARDLLRRTVREAELVAPAAPLLLVRALFLEWVGRDQSANEFLTMVGTATRSKSQRFEEFLSLALLAWIALRHLRLPEAAEHLAAAELLLEGLGEVWRTLHELLHWRLALYRGEFTPPAAASAEQAPVFLTSLISENRLYTAALAGERISREVWVRTLQHTFGGDPVRPAGGAGSLAAISRGDAADLSGAPAAAGGSLPLAVSDALELARRGDRTRAREGLVSAIGCATRVGALELAAHLQEHLERLDVSRMDQLTAMEEQTARLAARGLTNKEIARELFISLRTVETHLTHVYRKLGVPGRAGVARVLGPDLDHQAS